MGISAGIWFGAGAIAWTALVLLGLAVARGPRRDVVWVMAWLAVRLYARLLHRLRIEGRENIPVADAEGQAPGPLVIVSNHTAGVDPMLIHAACPFEIRWMMTRQMMVPIFSRVWAWMEIIPVEHNGRDSTSLRTALRHLSEGGRGGVIGIFAEGGLERPPRVIMPYLPGVGLLVLKSKAKVLPVVIEGTPVADQAYFSLFMPSRACVRFLPVREYSVGGPGAAGIASELEVLAAETLGWPRADPKLA